MNGFIYKLIFSSGKSYVGATTQSVQKRYKGHEKSVLKGSSCAVHNAWRKYGAPDVFILSEMPKEDLLDAEALAIKSHNTIVPFGYNQLAGGKFSPMHNAEIRGRVSEALKGHKINVGRKHTEKSKANMTLAQKSLNKTISQEHKEILSKRTAERHASGGYVEAYKKIAQAAKGRSPSAETRLKMSAWQKGRPKTSASK